jgi:WD40 repeat protein
MIWSACSGTRLYTLHGHTDAVRSCAWAPDGSLLATSSNDHSAKLWGISHPPALKVFFLILGARRRRKKHPPPELWNWLLDEFLATNPLALEYQPTII